MQHIFDGTWTHHEVDDTFPPESPDPPKKDFNLVISSDGVIDLERSDVDGRKLQSGSVDGERSFELLAKDGRLYKGWVVRHYICNGQVHLVIAGMYQDPRVAPGKAKAGGKKLAEAGQNEGDWVITKP